MSRRIEIKLHPVQHAFVHSKATFRGFVGGRGANGKGRRYRRPFGLSQVDDVRRIRHADSSARDGDCHGIVGGPGLLELDNSLVIG